MSLNIPPPGNNKKEEISLVTFIIAKILIISAFILDLFLPLGYTIWLFYIVPLFYVSVKYKSPVFTNLISGFSIVLIIAGYFLGKLGMTSNISFFNRAIGIVVFLIVTYILNYKKSLETKLIESEDLFRLTFEQAGSGIIHTYTEGRWIRFNDKYCEIIGHTRGELERLSPNEIIHPDDIEIDLKCRARLISGEITSYKIEKRYIRSDSSIAWTIFTGTIARETSSGEPFIVGVVEDITKLKRVEHELRISEEKFRTIAETMPLIVWTADPNGELDYSNQWGINFSGLSLEEVKGWGWIKMLHPDDLENASEKWKRSIQTGEIFEDTSQFRRHDGQYRWFLTRAISLKDSSGKIIKWLGTSTDIHEYKTSEERLTRVLEELGRSNKELEQFAYVASHDLQEPLRAVKGYMKLLSEKYKNELDEKAGMYIDFAVEGAERMSSLIYDLLMYARVTTKAKKLEPVDLNNVLEDVLMDMHLAIEENKAVIKCNELPRVNADDVQMRQLFQNLIANAIKFRSNENPEIKIDTVKKESHWLIRVKDNGIGIDAKQAERIFLIFQRLHEKEKYPGTGIGLAMCKKIIERHGGHIWVESNEGKGSTFYFTLPS